MLTVRCALTLIAIQAPGESRTCGLCGREVLTEQSLLSKDDGLESEEDILTEAESTKKTNGLPNGKYKQEHQMSLTEILLLAYDVCIYCNGKYIG